MLALMVVAMAADPSASQQLEEAEVVVARHRLFRGQRVTGDDLETAKMRAHQVPDDVVTDPDVLVGRVLLAPTYEGSLFRLARFADPERGSGIEALLPDGYRLFTYQLPSADRSFRAGNMVDVVHVAAGCAVTERAEVLAVRRGNQRILDSTDDGAAEALELALPATVLPRMSPTNDLVVLLRNRIDMDPSGLPACGPDAAPDAP